MLGKRLNQVFSAYEFYFLFQSQPLRKNLGDGR